MRRFSHAQGGMTLIEVMVTILVICTGSLATLATYSQFSDATLTARDRSVLNSVAQREIERLRPITYEQLALATAPTAQAATEAPLTGRAAAEPAVVGGIVRPGGDEVTYDNVRMRIYRYVTVRVPVCEALNAKVRAELATLFAASLTSIQAALPSACTATTKRITVVAVPVDDDGATDRGVTLTTVERDPESLTLVEDGGLSSNLSLDPIVDAAQGGATTGPAQTQTQTVTLLDTRCSDTVRDAPSSHETRDTAQEAFTCTASGPAPTLMTLAGVPGLASDPIADFSTDVTRAAVGGLAMLRDTQAGSCTAPTGLVYTNAQTEERKHSLHKWATTAPAVEMQTPTSGARASVTLYASTADGTPGPARLCATLQRRDGFVLGSADFRLGSWPGRVTELVTAFDLIGTTVPAGQQLILTLRVPQDSAEDLRILYDHPAYQSSLSFTTVTGKGLQ